MYLLPPNPGPLGTLEQWGAWRDELLALGKDTPGVDVELAVAELAIRDQLAEMVGASKELGLYDKEQANLTAEMLQTLQGIFDPANAHLFSAEAAQQAFAHVPIKKR